MYYIATDKKLKKIIISKNYISIFNFIMMCNSVKLYTIDYNAKPRNIDKRTFLKMFSKNVDDNNKLFELSKKLIPLKTNLRFFLKSLSLIDDFDFYEENKNTIF